MAIKKHEAPSKRELVAIRARLNDGKLTKDDITKLHGLVKAAEESAAALRAAVVE